jgi:hypothetical protein
MAERRQHPLKRQLRDARREHRARPYPGDLAADLGLSARPRTRAWRLRLGIAAAVAVTALLAGAWLVKNNPTDPPPTTAETRSDPPQHAGDNHPAMADDAVQDTEPGASLPVLARIDPAALQAFEDRFASASQRANHDARKQLSTRWGSRVSPPLPGGSTAVLSAAIGGVPRTLPVSIEFPDGLHMPTLTFPTLSRKDLS